MAKFAASPLSPEEVMRMRIQQTKGRVNTQQSIGDLLGAEPAIVDEHNRRHPNSRASTSIEFETSPFYKLYKKTAQGHFTPVKVFEESVPHCLDAGYSTTCPDCGTADCDEDPNSCTGRLPIPFMRCPVSNCNSGNPKKIFDDPLIGSTAQGELTPGELEQEAAPTTPRERILILRNRHISEFHRTEAPLFGVQAAPRQMEAQAVI